MFSWLNDLRIVFKIGLIALLMGGTMVGLVADMASRMSGADQSYSDP
ncbi:MAG: hypothetical protein V7634_1159 [Bradyrhizobium sp.]|jgi:methyl-accepting chemotaxis protein